MTSSPSPYGTPEPGAPLPLPNDTLSKDSDAELRALALKRLKLKRAFRTHPFTYAAVNGMLWVIWLVTAVAAGAWFPWPIFPSLGWGIGLAFNWWAAYGPAFRGLTESDIAAEMRRLRRE